MQYNFCMRFINVFDADGYTFDISVYQRPFVWNIKNIEALHETLNDSVFFGIGVVIESKEKVFDVIDGQQRLITFALLFGHLKNIKINLNIDSLTDKDLFKKIMSTADVEKLNRIKTSSHFLKKILTFKKMIVDESGTFGNLESLKNKLIENKHELSFVVLEPSVNVVQTFIRMNEKGEELNVADFYKAALIEKYSDADETFDNKSWSAAMEKYECLISDSIFNPKIGDLFAQAYNSQFFLRSNENINSKVWLTSGRKVFSNNFLVDVTDVFDRYIAWATNVLPKKNSTINNFETISFITFSNKVISGSAPLLFSIKNWNVQVKEKSAKMQRSFFLIGLLNNLLSNAKTKISVKEINWFYKKMLKEFNSNIESNDCLDVLNKKLLSEITNQFNSWDGELQEGTFKKAKYNYSAESDIGDGYKMNFEVAKFAISLKSTFIELSFLKKNKMSELSESYDGDQIIFEGIKNSQLFTETEIDVVINSVGYKKMMPKTISIEHLLNKGTNELVFLELVDKKVNNTELDDKDFGEKIKIIKSHKDVEDNKVVMGQETLKNYEAISKMLNTNNKDGLKELILSSLGS